LAPPPRVVEVASKGHPIPFRAHSAPRISPPAACMTSSVASCNNVSLGCSGGVAVPEIRRERSLGTHYVATPTCKPPRRPPVTWVPEPVVGTGHLSPVSTSATPNAVLTSCSSSPQSHSTGSSIALPSRIVSIQRSPSAWSGMVDDVKHLASQAPSPSKEWQSFNGCESSQLLLPAPHACWQSAEVPVGTPSPPVCTTPGMPANVVSWEPVASKAPCSAPGSYVPPTMAAPAPSVTVRMPGPNQAAAAGLAGALPPTTAPSIAGSGSACSSISISPACGAGVGFRDAVAKVSARALREYRQNHRVSLCMEDPA